MSPSKPATKKKAKKLKRDCRTLKAKALSSLKTALVAFNSLNDEGRTTTVLLHLQHSAEMLLKAALLQNGYKLFERGESKSIGYKKCLAKVVEHLKVSEEIAGPIRSIDALRDVEQHWVGNMSEELFYLEVRAFLTAFDKLLKQLFGESIADTLPIRVLPISTQPPTGDLDVLFNSEFDQIKKLLAPGRRQRDEARGKIRSLLAVEAHAADEVEVLEKDVNRIEKAVKAGKGIAEVFPRLTSLSSTTMGEGVQIEVTIVKKGGAPIRYVAGDDPTEFAAVRTVDLQRRFRYPSTLLGKHVDLTPHQFYAVRQQLNLDNDPTSSHVFEFESQRIKRYSDDAIVKIREFLKGNDLAAVVKAYNAKQPHGRRGRNVRSRSQ
ncbi:MAG: DUF3644 domain-containing protein [Vulcanimicrobiaceae bacterium]